MYNRNLLAFLAGLANTNMPQLTDVIIAKSNCGLHSFTNLTSNHITMFMVLANHAAGYVSHASNVKMYIFHFLTALPYVKTQVGVEYWIDKACCIFGLFLNHCNMLILSPPCVK